MEEIEPVDFKTIIVNHTRPKREAFKAANSFRDSLTTYHPLKTLPEDAIYLLLIKITPVSEVTEGESLQLVINWKGPRGYLNAIDEPLLRFYGLMVALYSVLLLGWLYLCARKWKDLLKIQYWIGAVILVGLIEKAVFYTEYMVANDTGITTIGMIEFAELISSIKKTMARVLIIIVSLGYGVVKPRLGETFNQVGVVGGLYLVFSVIEGVMRTSWKPAEGIKERQFATIPLIFFEVAIFWWVFSSLSATIRALSIRGNDIKRNLYMKFANILGLSVISSVIFLVWYLWNHVFQHCLTDWKELWFDVAFWHLLFCSVLISIMFLWRPAVNNQRFAFTPLLDDSEDDADDTFAVNTSCIDEIVTKRTNTSLNTKTLSVRKSDVDDSIERDMKWIEDNIPTTFVERFLLDDEEDEDAKRLEISKIL
uniref:GpcrRhopsn4 domain-containing protein n=1 Tax=Rhabditophanes sp. KR3021 TaxID=114890 RepID=A0AC35U4V8_9BILA